MNYSDKIAIILLCAFMVPVLVAMATVLVCEARAALRDRRRARRITAIINISRF